MRHTTDAKDQVRQIAAEIGSSIMDDNKVWTNRFTVKSTSARGTVYTVAQRKTDAVWGCSCPGWRHHRRCKHLVDVLARLAALPPESLDVDAEVIAMLTSARTAYLDLEGPRASVHTAQFSRNLEL